MPDGTPEDHAPDTFMLDTEMFTRLQEDRDALSAFLSRGRPIRVLVTDVQHRQVRAPSDAGRDERVAMLDRTELVGAAGAWDVTRWGHSRWATEAEGAEIASVARKNAMPKNRRKNAADGVIAAAAKAHGAALVMTDKDSRARAIGAGVRVWSWDQFRRVLVDST